jgi:hypothetical protein
MLGSRFGCCIFAKGFLSCWRKEIQVIPEVLTIDYGGSAPGADSRIASKLNDERPD